jgi:hypothetical protein
MDTEQQELPVIDHLDAEIIMHRDVHFAGQFSIMLHYYEQEGKGVRPEFNPRRILDLSQIEQTYRINLKEHLLSSEQKARVQKAQKAYQDFKKMYELAKDPNSPSLKLADLILSEEESPVPELEAVIELKDKLLEELLLLIQNDDFYDPLFPGYGFAPELAAYCLGKMGSAHAIQPLFDRIAKVDFYIEDVILEALKNIGKEAKNFLITEITRLPLSESNDRAAVALIHFRQDHEVACLALQLLKDPAYRQSHTLMGYLIVISEGLKGLPQAQAFKALKEDTSLPKLLRDDIDEVTQHWS